MNLFVYLFMNKIAFGHHTSWLDEAAAPESINRCTIDMLHT